MATFQSCCGLAPSASDTTINVITVDLFGSAGSGDESSSAFKKTKKKSISPAINTAGKLNEMPSINLNIN